MENLDQSPSSLAWKVVNAKAASCFTEKNSLWKLFYPSSPFCLSSRTRWCPPWRCLESRWVVCRRVMIPKCYAHEVMVEWHLAGAPSPAVTASWSKYWSCHQCQGLFCCLAGSLPVLCSAMRKANPRYFVDVSLIFDQFCLCYYCRGLRFACVVSSGNRCARCPPAGYLDLLNWHIRSVGQYFRLGNSLRHRLHSSNQWLQFAVFDCIRVSTCSVHIILYSIRLLFGTWGSPSAWATPGRSGMLHLAPSEFLAIRPAILWRSQNANNARNGAYPTPRSSCCTYWEYPKESEFQSMDSDQCSVAPAAPTLCYLCW